MSTYQSSCGITMIMHCLQFINTFESEIQILLQTEISLEKKIVQGVEEIERIKDQW